MQLDIDGQCEPRPACAPAQAGLGSRCPYTFKVSFQMKRIKINVNTQLKRIASLQIEVLNR